MSSPSPDELLRRLRAIYCRHRCLTYEQYDQMVAEERITFQEVKELVDVLYTELQNTGLYEYLFSEEVAQRAADKKRLAEIEAQLKRIGSVPLFADMYKHIVPQLVAEGNEIKRRLT